ncbi:MAG: hypothetical protein RMZ41_016535 [Nostoc sp. DedVER02]|uniref:hypothetical protein n=1 Tax=unclassified Nostoc TaxID=2593658 RepID=UPI002AD30B69|nr:MULTISPECIES: hypothetical protein [unclassified Nostoc]MDZ7988459.1 hypothetical protein [Nostoc sp. DedVER02]MDZ8112197.1 hypothetical protein [Nostoc sp. DedVER01b]
MKNAYPNRIEYTVTIFAATSLQFKEKTSGIPEVLVPDLVSTCYYNLSSVISR